MEFSPAFSLLLKFTVGLDRGKPNIEETRVVAGYLGVALSDQSLGECQKILSLELSQQNRFLPKQLERDSIFESDEYCKSMFIKEIVANNRL